MPRLNLVAPEQASGRVKELYDGLKATVGVVPNIYRGVANSPAALDVLLGMGAKLREGSLTAAQTEAVKLVVSQVYGCHYCLAAHTLVGKKAGLTEGDTLAIRRGTIADSGLQALVRFVNVAIQPGGRISDDELNAIRGAGFNDAQITEVLMVLAQTVFTTLFNRANRTEVDFPAAPGL
ncbi:MAG: carboxymuconolactone decarboxylase family protein [Betaproteobacteria bacterium]|nr:MAG: carboxymuconolactone decarboxylase family protein [Betaproteobacteria bacterium]